MWIKRWGGWVGGWVDKNVMEAYFPVSLLIKKKNFSPEKKALSIFIYLKKVIHLITTNANELSMMSFIINIKRRYFCGQYETGNSMQVYVTKN